MVYAFEPVPPEAPPPLGMALDGGATAGSEAAPMSPTSAPSAPGDSDADMECSAADGCGLRCGGAPMGQQLRWLAFHSFTLRHSSRLQECPTGLLLCTGVQDTGHQAVTAVL
jgi:hypothetical protein